MTIPRQNIFLRRWGECDVRPSAGPMNNSEPMPSPRRFQRGGFRCEAIACGRYRVVSNRTVSVSNRSRKER